MFCKKHETAARWPSSKPWLCTTTKQPSAALCAWRPSGQTIRGHALTRKSMRLLCASLTRLFTVPASGAVRASAYPPHSSAASSTPRASSCASPGAPRSNEMTGVKSSVIGTCADWRVAAQRRRFANHARVSHLQRPVHSLACAGPAAMFWQQHTRAACQSARPAAQQRLAHRLRGEVGQDPQV